MRRLTFDNEMIHFADFIPHTNKIVFIQRKYGVLYHDLFTIDTNSGVREKICQLNAFENVSFSWMISHKKAQVSADGKFMYVASSVVSENATTSRDVLKINLETKEVINLTNNNNTERIMEISLSHNNDKLVYVEEDYFLSKYSIISLNLQTNQKRILYTTTSSFCFHPQYLSDGESVFWMEESSFAAIASRLMLLKADSVIIVDDTPNKYYDFNYPHLSENNSILLKAPSLSKKFTLFNLDTGEKSISAISTYYYPSVSIDRTKFIYFQGNNPLILTDAAGSELFSTYVVLPNDGDNIYPKLSLDNSSVLFINVIRAF